MEHLWSKIKSWLNNSFTITTSKITNLSSYMSTWKTNNLGTYSNSGNISVSMNGRLEVGSGITLASSGNTNGSFFVRTAAGVQFGAVGSNGAYTIYNQYSGSSVARNYVLFVFNGSKYKAGTLSQGSNENGSVSISGSTLYSKLAMLIWG